MDTSGRIHEFETNEEKERLENLFGELTKLTPDEANKLKYVEEDERVNKLKQIRKEIDVPDYAKKQSIIKEEPLIFTDNGSIILEKAHKKCRFKKYKDEDKMFIIYRAMNRRARRYLESGTFKTIAKKNKLGLNLDTHFTF